MSISNEAVEAAAKALYALQINQAWGAKPEWVAVYEGYATGALQAAAPHMQTDTDDALRAAWDRGYATAIAGMEGVPASAWDEGYDAGVREERPGWTQNPYRTTA